MSKHTQVPGDVIYDDGFYSIGVDGIPVKHVPNAGLIAENERLREINAVMFEALGFICDRYSNPPTAQDPRPNIYSLAKAAIAKAKGEA